MSVAAPAPTVTIHPLAISAICDHYTRVRAGGSTIPTNAPVMGLLFGTKPQGEKSSASIFDATDVFYEVDAQNQAPIIRAEEVKSKCELIFPVYPKYKLLGWYYVGESISPEIHLSIHQSLASSEFIEDAHPLLVLMHADGSHQQQTQSHQFPLDVFEAEERDGTQFFVDVPFALESNTSENIAIDLVTKEVAVAGISAFEAHNAGMVTSLGVLEEELSLLIDVLRAMRAGQLEIDHELLRRANKLAHQLPTLPLSPSPLTSSSSSSAIGRGDGDLTRLLAEHLAGVYVAGASTLTRNVKDLVDSAASLTLLSSGLGPTSSSAAAPGLGIGRGLVPGDGGLMLGDRGRGSGGAVDRGVGIGGLFGLGAAGAAADRRTAMAAQSARIQIQR